MIHNRLFAVGICAALAATAGGCVGSGSAPASPGAQTFFGASQAIGNGTGRAYVSLDSNSVPTEVGIEITETSRTGLPANPPDVGGGPAIEYVFAAPSQLASTPFTRMSLFYTPGHQPTAVYGTPHYHPIFSLATDAERAQMTFAGSPGTAPPATAVPAGYISFHLVQPGIGDIYITPTNPNYIATPFNASDQDFGYFQGQMSAINLTVAQAWLNLHPIVTYPIAQPQTYRSSGYYPTTYSVQYNANTQTYRFALGSFVKR